MKKNCVTCGDEFEPKTNATTCGVECRKKRRIAYLKEYYRKNNPKNLVIPKKNCLNCGQEFQPFQVSKKIKFCRYDCGSLYWKRQTRLKNRTWDKKTCIICSSNFKASTPSDKSCSPECKEIRIKDRTKLLLKNKIISCKNCGRKFSKIGNTLNCSKECTRKIINKWAKEYMKKTPIQSLAQKIRGSLVRSLKGIRKEKPTFVILGYSKEELALHLESFFTEENGYTWDNMGEWHIDHIRPVSSFNFDSIDHPDFKKCWALNNLQPLWALDNMRKGNKWDGIINR